MFVFYAQFSISINTCSVALVRGVTEGAESSPHAVPILAWEVGVDAEPTEASATHPTIAKVGTWMEVRHGSIMGSAVPPHSLRRLRFGLKWHGTLPTSHPHPLNVNIFWVWIIGVEPPISLRTLLPRSSSPKSINMDRIMKGFICIRILFRSSLVLVQLKIYRLAWVQTMSILSLVLLRMDIRAPHWRI